MPAGIINAYYGTWAYYDSGFNADHINPRLCTHISYSFFGIEEGSGKFKMLDRNLDIDKDMISKTVALKQKNRKLKVLAVVGGWNESTTTSKYSDMAADSNKRKKFISSALDFIRNHGFDGLDLDWEYPAQGKGRSEDKKNFVKLLKELHEAFQPFKLELGIAVAAAPGMASVSYDIPKISKYVDFINLMAYDLQDNGRLSFNAPLTGQGQSNVKECVKYWLDHGAPASKLILGVAFYGQRYCNFQKPTVGSKAKIWSSVHGGENTLTYFKILRRLRSKNYHYKFDSEFGAPFCYNDEEWISFDDEQSIKMKVEFAKSKNLRGVMIWSLDMDDFNGKYGEEDPLMKIIKKKL